ncbi:MAG: Anti-sigma factor [Pseudomonadota bacterium]|jgi:serine/threonine-protein kinase RsbW
MDHELPSPRLDTAGLTFLDADIPATLDEVSRLCAELNLLANARGGVTWAAEIDLGMTEVLTNVVRHGYGDTGHGRITLTCRTTAVQWHLSVHDRGSPIPTDLLAQADGSVFDFDPDDLDNIPEGGMGLALIRGCFDQLDYVADDTGNRLYLVKDLPPSTD